MGGFPYCPNVRRRFASLVEQTGLRATPADVRLLSMHQCVEGATVGPRDFQFRSGADVVRAAELPPEVAAVVTGHIHRHQLLCHDLGGRPLATPVLYPGSTERTSFAEMAETRGVVLLELHQAPAGGVLSRWRFRPLPTRPMHAVELRAAGLDRPTLEGRVQRLLAAAPPDAVVRLRISGEPTPDAAAVLRAASLRALLPAGMNLSVQRIDQEWSSQSSQSS